MKNLEKEIIELLKNNKQNVDYFNEHGEYDPNPYWLADELVKLFSLHHVKCQRELLIALLAHLEKAGGNEFINKAQIVDSFLSN